MSTTPLYIRTADGGYLAAPGLAKALTELVAELAAVNYAPITGVEHVLALRRVELAAWTVADYAVDLGVIEVKS